MTITITYVVGGDSYVVTSDRGDGEVTFTATPQLWQQLTSGALDPVVAFMQGKLKMAGDHAGLYDLLPTFPLPA
jgi:putative sterol carrier protein